MNSLDRRTELRHRSLKILDALLLLFVVAIAFAVAFFAYKIAISSQGVGRWAWMPWPMQVLIFSILSLGLIWLVCARGFMFRFRGPYLILNKRGVVFVEFPPLRFWNPRFKRRTWGSIDHINFAMNTVYEDRSRSKKYLFSFKELDVDEDRFFDLIYAYQPRLAVDDPKVVGKPWSRAVRLGSNSAQKH